eukprot:2767695-Pleurochrysis_carterae.AAC.9
MRPEMENRSSKVNRGPQSKEPRGFRRGRRYQAPLGTQRHKRKQRSTMVPAVNEGFCGNVV